MPGFILFERGRKGFAITEYSVADISGFYIPITFPGVFIKDLFGVGR